MITPLESRWQGVHRPYTPAQVARLRGSVPIVHTLAQRGARQLWRLLKEEPYVQALGALTGGPGGADGPGRAQGHLWLRLAGGGGRQPGRADLPGPEPVPGELGAGPGQAHQRRPAAGGPGGVRRGRPRPGLAGAHRGGRRGGLRRPPERLRADEGADRGRRGGGALRGPVEQREEVRPPGGKVLVPTGQFIRTLAAARLAADVLDVPTVLVARTDADSASLLTSDVDERDRPFLTGERTPEGFFRHPGRAGLRRGPGPGLRPLRRRALVRDLHSGPGPGPDLRRGRPDACPGRLLAYNCSPSFNWRKNLSDPESPPSSGNWGPWATSSSSSPWPGSTP